MALKFKSPPSPGPGLPPAGAERERILAAIAADLAPLRTVNAAESAVLNTLIKIFRDPDVEPETHEEAASWLATTGKRRMLERLVARQRLHAPAPDDQATLEFIHALIEHRDEALVAAGLIDLGGYLAN
jgi:DNA-directed RNA polymerase specialized sigma24 family protein